MLKINPSKQVDKFLRKLPVKHARQIAKKIMMLRENPYPQNAKKLFNTTYIRADAGEYRIIYFIEDNTLYIPLIGKRNDGEVYKKWRNLVK